jgi:hypothetical protein
MTNKINSNRQIVNIEEEVGHNPMMMITRMMVTRMKVTRMMVIKDNGLIRGVVG